MLLQLNDLLIQAIVNQIGLFLKNTSTVFWGIWIYVYSILWLSGLQSVTVDAM